MTGARLVRATAAVALVAALLTFAPPSRAQTARDGTDARLTLVAQPTTATLGSTTTLHIAVPIVAPTEQDNRTLRLRLYNRLSSLDAFERSATGGRLAGRLDTDLFAVGDLPRAPDGSLVVSIGVGNDAPLPALAASVPGVYPLEVALLEGGDPAASFVTWLVVVDADEPVAEPLSIAFVWSLVSDPVRGVNGALNPAATGAFSPGGRLDAISTLLAEVGSMPLTLQIGPETLEGWVALAQTEGADATVAAAVDRVTTAAAQPTTQLLLAPYVPIDLTALEAAGLGTELPEQIVTGSDTIERLTDVRPQPRTAFADPIDGPVLARLRQLLVDRIVVRDTQVEGLDDGPALAPFTVNAGSGVVRAAATTSLVDDALSGAEPVPLRIQRTLGALSVVAFDEPDVARGIVVATPQRWTPDVDAYAALVNSLREHPLLHPVTLDTYFDDLHTDGTGDGEDEGARRALVAVEPGGFPVTGAEYVAAKQALSSLRSTIPAQSPALVEGERALLLALSTAQRPEAAQAQLAVIDAAVQQLDAGVSTTNKRVTVTSRRAAVPLSFRNDTGQPVRVRVRLESTKLLFPNGDEVAVVLPPGNHTERFTVEARTSGTFTMTVTLATGDGRRPIGAPTRVTVRSAVFSGVGAALTAGALIFLALWWGNHFRRTRRARAAAPNS